jgi:NADPH:quinone reductase
MRAVVCQAFGPPESLVVTEVPDPVAGPGQVVIDVAASSVMFPDFLMIQDQYQFKPGLPFTPGTEVSGTVSAVGEGVTELAVGDRVLTGVGSGGMAEKVVAPAARAVKLPEGVDLVSLPGFLYAYGTSHHALKDRAKLQPGETLVVLGAAGGVGLAAVELGARAGARVIAAASTEEKLELCRAHGAADTINYATQDLKTAMKDLTGGKGADVVYDAVGGPYAEPAIRSTAWDGRFLVIGFAAGEIPRIPLNLALLKGLSIVGVFYGSWSEKEPARQRENVDELLGWLRDGQLHPYVHEAYPLERAPEAIRALADRKVLGKVVVRIGG